MKKLDFPLGRLLARIHRDERGGVSIETILIIAAIALPILIFLIRVGWPPATAPRRCGSGTSKPVVCAGPTCLPSIVSCTGCGTS